MRNKTVCGQINIKDNCNTQKLGIKYAMGDVEKKAEKLKSFVTIYAIGQATRTCWPGAKRSFSSNYTNLHFHFI